MILRPVIRWLTPLLLAGCALTSSPADYLSRNDIPYPDDQGFAHCRGYGCASIDLVSLNADEWKSVTKDLPAISADKERAAIAKNVGTFETIVGDITDTGGDVAGTYVQPGPYQLDCIDESTNTTIFLTMLEQRGLLKHHTVGAPDTRVPFGVGVFVSHRTAVITDTKTGISYAIDSWFHDNGKHAEIVPLKRWKNRWHPGDPLS